MSISTPLCSFDSDEQSHLSGAWTAETAAAGPASCAARSSGPVRRSGPRHQCAGERTLSDSVLRDTCTCNLQRRCMRPARKFTKKIANPLSIDTLHVEQP